MILYKQNKNVQGGVRTTLTSTPASQVGVAFRGTMAWLLALSVINACEILMCNLLFKIGGADNATKCKTVNGQVRPRPHAHTAAGLNARGRGR